MDIILPDIPRLYTALAEWLACLLCILEVKRRLSGWKFIGFSALILVIQSAFLILTKGMSGFWWIFCMAVAVGTMYFFIGVCCDISKKDVGYYCARAFVIAEFAASLEWQLDCYFYTIHGWIHGWMRLILLVAVYTIIYYI